LGSVRHDKPKSCVILIKGKQFGVAAISLTGFKIAPQILHRPVGGSRASHAQNIAFDLGGAATLVTGSSRGIGLRL
jgi:hypothetical protein